VTTKERLTMKKSSLALALILLLLPSLSWAWSGRVVGVIDGDRITVLHDGKEEVIRLWGIDCPEKGQDFGTKAKQATSRLVFGRIVEVEPVNVDRHGRTVAIVTVGRTVVNEELIRQGLAWVDAQHCERPVCRDWEARQIAAQGEGLGLWADLHAVPSWQFRRRK
jgi:micrococcal nuclease